MNQVCFVTKSILLYLLTVCFSGCLAHSLESPQLVDVCSCRMDPQFAMWGGHETQCAFGGLGEIER